MPNTEVRGRPSAQLENLPSALTTWNVLRSKIACGKRAGPEIALRNSPSMSNDDAHESGSSRETRPIDERIQVRLQNAAGEQTEAPV